MKKRILCALLSAMLVMNVGIAPVGAAPTEVSATENPSAETESLTVLEAVSQAAEENFAWYDEAQHQIVWNNSAFEAGKTYKVSIGETVSADVIASAGGVLRVSASVDGVCTLTAADEEETKEYSVRLDTSIAGTHGTVKEYPNGKVQVEDLQESQIEGKMMLVYSDASENVLSLIVDSKGTAVVDISSVNTIHHVDVIDYRKTADGSYSYGCRRQLAYQKVSLGVPTLKSVSNGECKFSITWNAVPYASEYYVYKTDANGNATGERTVCTTTTFECSGVRGNTTYYYVVAAAATGRNGLVVGSSSAVMKATPTMKALEKVTSFKAKAGDNQVSLSWAKVPNATKYVVQQSVTGTGEWKDIATTTGTSYVCKNLINDKQYSFMVRAMRTANGYTVNGANAHVTAIPKLVKPVKPTNLTVTEVSSGNKLTWKSSGKVTGFIVYSYNYDKGAYEKLATVKGATSYIHKEAKSTERYKYAVRAYRNDNGKYYETAYVEKIIYGQKLVADIKASVHPMYYTAYTKKKVGMFKTQWETSSSKYIRVLKKGTKITVIRNHPQKPKIRLADGTEGFTYRGAIRLSKEHFTSQDYTKQQIECFVNQKGYASSTKYLIWVATYPQRIYVFSGSKGNWKLIRSGKCATGAITTPDYPGEQKITKKVRWHRYGSRFYQLISYMADGNKIHTRPAYKKSGKYVDARLGRPLSHGCIRTTDSDASFIYNNCKKNTKVVIY